MLKTVVLLNILKDPVTLKTGIMIIYTVIKCNILKYIIFLNLLK